MTPLIPHDWDEKTSEAKARWFQSLSPQERLEVFDGWMEIIFAIRPDLRNPPVTGWKAEKARILSLH